ncbi:tRNA pseudouridine(13) synthase TruD [Candidatus Woesearchaeota archaeon]|nr:tRNA pseudouridine(13) synthase TruD [Candidatus Woesearchaeota archaeon]
MKLKQCPEDFIVEEINDSKPSQAKKGFQLFLLEKKGIETFSLLEQLSRKNNIPVSEFGIAGVKDRHGITQQFITVPSSYSLKPSKEQNLSLSFLGYVDKALELGDLTGNKFTLMVRAVRRGEFEGIYQKAQTLSQSGVPNYFDSQRFGSVINGKFIAKYLLKKNYEEAVKIYLTESSPFESRIIKEDKQNILHCWPMLEKCSVKTPSLRFVVDEYKKTKNWLFAYRKISSSLRQMYVSSYQSYLWNECIKLLLKHFIDKKKLYSIPYNVGSLLFYKNLTTSESKKLSIAFKTISDELQAEGLELDIIKTILKREGITLSDFAIKSETGSFFKTHQRDVIVKPLDFSISKPQIDEVNDRGKNNFFKIKLSFTLPKGSYATIVTKRLFNH